MSHLSIDVAKCKGCGLCIKSCGTNAITMVEKVAQVNDRCVLCGLCVESCPFDAISITKEENSSVNTEDFKDLFVYIEVQQGQIAAVSLELLGAGQRLAKRSGCQLVAVLVDANALHFAQELVGWGADRVLYHTKIAGNVESHTATVLDWVVATYKPEFFLFGATGLGRSLAPRVAAKAQTGLTADCTVLEIDDDTGLLRQTRPAFGGNLMATIVCPNRRPQMSTVRPGIMEKLEFDQNRTGVLEKLYPEVGTSLHAPTVLSCNYTPKTRSIADADKLVVVGRGIGSKKNMKLAYQFADKIGAQVAVSRPLVDLGYAPYAQQVGQTGCTVAPKLLISLGVSGAIQHLAGIARAEKIVAINTDEAAPIFNVSHYKVIGDCIEILNSYLDSSF